MNKTMKITSSIIRVAITLIALVLATSVIFGTRAFAASQKEPALPDVKIDTSEIGIGALPDETQSFNHKFFKEYGPIHVEHRYNESENLFLNIPNNFTTSPAHVKEIPSNLNDALEESMINKDMANVDTWISVDHKMAINIATYTVSENELFQMEEGFEFKKTLEKNSPYTLSYINSENGIAAYFVMDAKNAEAAASFEALADEIVSTMGIVPESNMLYWSFSPKENCELAISLTNDFIAYGTDNMEAVPEKLRTALEELDLGHIEEAKAHGMTELWFSENKKLVIQLAIRETDDSDYEENEVNLNFEKYYLGTSPVKISYTTIINGMSINVDFVADNATEEEAMEYEVLADTIIAEMDFTPDSAYILTNDRIDKVVTSRTSRTSVALINIIGIVVILKIASPIIKAVKKAMDNNEIESVKNVFTAGYEQKPKPNTQTRTSRDYGNEDEAYSNHEKDLGKDYSSQKPQVYNKDKYVVDNSRYRYGMDMSRESKLKKQDQVKSMLESGMIEKDEYNEKMHEIDRQYK